MATAAGGGYWIAATDGPCTRSVALRSSSTHRRRSFGCPCAVSRARPSGKGYWLAAGDGGLFAFGDAPYIGWPGPLTLRATIQGVSR